MASTPKASASTELWIALLGRRDTPADGLQDYCTFLGAALARHGVQLKSMRVEWVERGWASALSQVWRESANWRGKWVLLQYTALGWSRRGFPIGAVAAIAIARGRGARCAVVFHEPFGIPGPRWIDRVREACQNWVVRSLYRLAHKSIFSIPIETVPWLERPEQKSVFVPIGANIPEPVSPRNVERIDASKTVAVFCLSEPPNRQREVQEISNAIRRIATNGKKPRVIFLGKGTAEARGDIDRAFASIPAEILNLGVRPAEEVSRNLAAADAMLCVRGELYARRGSAIAGVACGLPIVGYGDAAKMFPLGEAGVHLVPLGTGDALGGALAQVLDDSGLHERLRLKSMHAQRKFFSWDVIATTFREALRPAECIDENTDLH
jgi:glycosyltransferase involved in cell wall biosynthesis